MRDCGRAFTLLLILLLGACSSKNEVTTSQTGQVAPAGSASASTVTAVGSTTPTTAGTTSTGVDVLKQEVVDAYQRSIETEHQAEQAMDFASPSLSGVMVDPLLSETRERIKGRKALGQAIRPAAEPKGSTVVLSVTVNDDTAELTECTVDDWVVFEPASGRVINDRIATGQWKATMKLGPDGWKVSERASEMEWKGIAGCAASSS